MPDGTKECVESEHRTIYVEALNCLVDSKIPVAVGGAFAVWFYTGRWRNTHDVDFFTTPEHVSKATEALTQAGFVDIGEQGAGDRDWIYHAVKGDIIVDVIWRFANKISEVTDEWLVHAKMGELLGVPVKFLPAEELVWSKMFTLNRHRCDWPDVMRVFLSHCGTFDWEHLLEMLGDHWLLFAGVVDVFDWQYPAHRGCIPDSIRRELSLRRLDCKPDPSIDNREMLLDPWIHSRPEDLCYWEQ